MKGRHVAAGFVARLAKWAAARRSQRTKALCQTRHVAGVKSTGAASVDVVVDFWKTLRFPQIRHLIQNEARYELAGYERVTS